MLGPHHDPIGEQIAGALDLRKLAAPQGGEQREADRAAEAAEVAGGLPQPADLVPAKGAPAVGGSLEALGARALGPAQAREDVVAGVSCAHAPFQERVGVL